MTKLRSDQVNTGAVVQIANYQTGSLLSATGTIPIDNTIPQITEGSEFFTLAFTPKSATNTLIIEITAYWGHTVQCNRILALFQDSTANALASAVTRDIANNFGEVNLRYKMTAGTTNSTTFRVRAGGDTAGTLNMNGVATNPYLGGSLVTNMTITEIVG